MLTAATTGGACKSPGPIMAIYNASLLFTHFRDTQESDFRLFFLLFTATPGTAGGPGSVLLKLNMT